MTAYDPHFLCQNPIILSKSGCLQKTRPKNIYFWTNGEQFCTIKKNLGFALKFLKISYFAQFWKKISEFWHVISNHTQQQGMNSIMGSNMAPLMVSGGKPQNPIGHERQGYSACSLKFQTPTPASTVSVTFLQINNIYLVCLYEASLLKQCPKDEGDPE